MLPLLPARTMQDLPRDIFSLQSRKATHRVRSHSLPVAAAAKITGTIAGTQLWVDGVKKYNAPGSATLTATINLSAGTHRFAVVAVNTSGQKWESAVNATVK